MLQRGGAEAEIGGGGLEGDKREKEVSNRGEEGENNPDNRLFRISVGGEKGSTWT